VFTGGSQFSPRTSTELSKRQAKVERRRLQAEAKAHKISMQQQQQELRHTKRTQALEYDRQFQETYGFSKTTAIAGGVGLTALIGYFMFS
jgi:hypothetical protein